MNGWRDTEIVFLLSRLTKSQDLSKRICSIKSILVKLGLQTLTDRMFGKQDREETQNKEKPSLETSQAKVQRLANALLPTVTAHQNSKTILRASKTQNKDLLHPLSLSVYFLEFNNVRLMPCSPCPAATL